MPFRLGKEYGQARAKIQFTTSAEMPHLIYRACVATGVQSNTVYAQRAIVAALARDLGLEEETLLSHLPTPRGPAAHLFDPDEATMSRYGVPIPEIGKKVLVGPASTIEQVS